MEILERIADCVEKGKADELSVYPPEMKGQKGAAELTREALDSGISPNEILTSALMAGMNKIGDKFAAGKAYIPQLLISAKAMNAAMVHLKPFFESGTVSHKGTFIIGTVKGDLHDIGKNIVKMVLAGAGWNVIDLGIDVPADKFSDAVRENKARFVGLSALLTTTMMNMEHITNVLKTQFSDIKIFVGGAPLSKSFSDKIGADGYFADPHSLVKHLETLL